MSKNADGPRERVPVRPKILPAGSTLVPTDSEPVSDPPEAQPS